MSCDDRREHRAIGDKLFAQKAISAKVASREGFELRLKEGYGVNIVIIFARCGAPNTADYPPQYAIAAERAPLCFAEETPAQKSVETATFGGGKVRIAEGPMVNFGTMWVAARSFFVLNGAYQTTFSTPTIAP